MNIFPTEPVTPHEALNILDSRNRYWLKQIFCRFLLELILTEKLNSPQGLL